MRNKRTVFIAVLLAITATALSGCNIKLPSVGNDSSETSQTSATAENISDETQKNSAKSDDNKSSAITLDGLPKGFPSEIPFYENPQIVESDNFNGNHYTVVYVVNADFNDVADFYVDAFNLDESQIQDGEVYYEGFEFGDILINGLTIERTSNGINVYMTLKDNSQEAELDIEEYDDDSYDDYDIDFNIYNDYYAGEDNDSGVGAILYDTAEEVPLSDSYPDKIVPIYPKAKVIGCSMVPGMNSGYVELVLPPDDYDKAVEFYTDKLGITPVSDETSLAETTKFNGTIDNVKVSVWISHILTIDNDPCISITVDEQ